MTFSMGRQAPMGGKLVDFSGPSINKSIRKIKESVPGEKPLLLNMKHANTQQAGSKQIIENQLMSAVFGPQKLKTKKEEDRDKKVEALLEAYKKQDQELLKREQKKDFR
jgi:hypothetical protein